MEGHSDVQVPAEAIVPEHDHDVQASTNLTDGRHRVLKQGETFAIFDRIGDIHAQAASGQGLYH